MPPSPIPAPILGLWRAIGGRTRSGDGDASGDGAVAPAPDPVRHDGALMEEIFRIAPDPVLIVEGGDPADASDRRIIRANGAALTLLRLAPESGPWPLYTAIRSPDLLEAIDEALYGGRDQTIDYQSGGAQERFWSAWTAPVSHQGATLAVVSLRDETEARRVERMRVDFLANASHELRTPLASLTGFIETLRGHARDDEAAREKFLGVMAVQADRMTRLVADLLSLSRVELNEHVPPSGRVDLAGAVSDVVDATAPLAARRGVTLKMIRQDEGPFDVTGDRDQIIQVIQNLTDNALKYSPGDGVVEIILAAGLTATEAARMGPPGAAGFPLLTPDRDDAVSYARVIVRDHGPGLKREAMPRLTERFYRAEGQKSGDRLGTGLGLAIVKHIVNRHHGGLRVESEPGEGAAFAVYFPLAGPKGQVQNP